MPIKSKRVHCCIHVSRVFFFLFWWDVALYPTLKQTAVLGCIKSSTSAVTRALRCQLRGRPFHPWAGRLRFSGEAHPGPATLTQSSSFSCGAGLQFESRLLLCCAPAVYMLADAAAVAAAVFGLEHLISYCFVLTSLVLGGLHQRSGVALPTGGRADPAVGNEALAGTRRSFFFAGTRRSLVPHTKTKTIFSTLKPILVEHACTRADGRIFFLGCIN